MVSLCRFHQNVHQGLLGASAQKNRVRHLTPRTRRQVVKLAWRPKSKPRQDIAARISRFTLPAGPSVYSGLISTTARALTVSGANPFVIAMAKDGGSHWIVVSDEHSGSLEFARFRSHVTTKKVPCISFQGLMFAEGWQFHQPSTVG